VDKTSNTLTSAQLLSERTVFGKAYETLSSERQKFLRDYKKKYIQVALRREVHVGGGGVGVKKKTGGLNNKRFYGQQ
jgi:hypothetical protein